MRLGTHLIFASPTAPVVVVDSSSSTTSLLSSSSLPCPLKTVSTLPPFSPTTSMTPITLSETFVSYFHNVPPQFSKVILNPQVKLLMTQIVLALSILPPPIEPPKMEATMQICEEMERLSGEQSKETMVDVIDEPEDSNYDDYYENVEEGLRIDLDEVALDEEGKKMLKDGEVNRFDTYYDVEILDQEPEVQQPEGQDDKEAIPQEHLLGRKS